MIQTHRLAGLALFLWGFYLVYSSLASSSEGPNIPVGEQPSVSELMAFYLPLVIGFISMVFGIYLMVRRKPIFPEEATTSQRDSLSIRIFQRHFAECFPDLYFSSRFSRRYPNASFSDWWKLFLSGIEYGTVNHTEKSRLTNE